MSINNLSAYEVIEDRQVADVNSRGILLRHKKSGARVAILSNDDDNKVFYIGFRTTPMEETGVPHIIEHTVLCGSDKFPVKDPFVELVKGSLNTFLNAMTYSDKTMYPVASYNDKDFKNLMDVYMDAVFHPNIAKYKEIFLQEGWHYELESEDAPITINGVVYNEMRGAYSSPEDALQNAINKNLFPDNTYGKDSGGNPEVIPTLTYEQYLDFYRAYYHPSNSYIYLYGDMDIEERLEWMDKEYLSHYEYLAVDSEIQPQKPFDKVREVETEYSIASDDSEENQTYLAYSRVVGDTLDLVPYLAFDVLDYALLSAPGAPVRKALIDAGIGEDVYGEYNDGIKQCVLSVIAKNANPSDKEQFIQIIEDTLKEQIEKGIDSDFLLAAINSLEFKFREADYGQFPKGLLFGIDCMDGWLFDDTKPFMHLECLDAFAKLREKIGTGYFEELVQKKILENTHGANVVVKPKRGLNTVADEALAKRLAAYKETLTKEEIQQMIADTKHLKEYQETPSPEEDLKKIPMLTREDMRKEATPLLNEEKDANGYKVVLHDVESNGIDYVTFMYDADDLAIENLGYFGLLSAAVGLMDTENYAYAALANAINIYTGGVYTSVGIQPLVKDTRSVKLMWEVHVKVMEENFEKAMEIADEMVRTTKLDDVKRLSEIVAQVKARLQATLSSNGHSVASMRALSYTSAYARYQDAVRGVDYYRFICEVDQKLKENPKEVTDQLFAVRNQILAANRLLISFTSNQTSYEKAVPVMTKYLNRIPAESTMKEMPELVFEKKNEGLIDASQIQYVARTGNFVKHGYAYSGALRILKIILSYDYMWINIRVKGGAYGCMSSFMRTGEAYFVSYRDPKLKETNDIFEHIPDYLRSFDPDERDMTKYIIGTFGSIDTPMYPEAKGARSMAAYIQKISFADIQRERDEVLNCTAKDIQNLADLIQSVLADECICVVGNENAIKDAKDIFLNIEKLYN